MHTIAELNMLLRERVELPVGFKLATEEFREGWNFMRTGDVHRLERKIQTRGWHFIKIADGLLRSGVGDTAQQAIASGLKLVLRRVSAHFNAVEVEHIALTRYPWFYLARVRVYAYRIQEGAVMPVSDEAPPEPVRMRSRRATNEGAAMHARFECAMPLLRDRLISLQIPESRIQ
jgi:hypothetical protein